MGDVVRIEDGVRLGGELAVRQKRLSPTNVGDDACTQDGAFWVDDCSEKEGTSHSIAVVENGNDVRVGSHIVRDALAGEDVICLRSK